MRNVVTRSHPSEAMLLAYAGGTLPSGSALVVAAHLEFCSDCRDARANWELLAGAMLEDMPESPLGDDALAATLLRLEAVDKAPQGQPEQPAAEEIPGLVLPAVIRAYGVKPRRWLAPGVWIAPIPAVSRGPAHTYLLRLGPNDTLPRHGHGGPEAICVLKGSFSDARGRYDLGDFAENDEAVEHEPVAGAEDECICIIASEGPPKAHGLTRWFLRQFTR
jgi:putative transcriptional regulator